MPFLPVTNATLIQVATGGTIEDYDQVAGADPTIKFRGSEDALVEEHVRQQSAEGTPGVLNKVKDTRIIFSADITPSFDLETDDDITYVYNGTTYVRKVLEFQSAEIPGLPVPAVTVHFRTGPTL